MQVDCRAIFESDEIDAAGTGKPVPWESLPNYVRDEFTHHGNITVENWYFDEAWKGKSRMKPEIFSKDLINNLGEEISDKVPYSVGAKIL